MNNQPIAAVFGFNFSIMLYKIILINIKQKIYPLSAQSSLLSALKFVTFPDNPTLETMFSHRYHKCASQTSIIGCGRRKCGRR